MDNIEKLKGILEGKIKILNRRIERRSGANFHNEENKTDLLYGEALAYENVLEILKTL